jgi:hypothetical protein
LAFPHFPKLPRSLPLPDVRPEGTALGAPYYLDGSASSFSSLVLIRFLGLDRGGTGPLGIARFSAPFCPYF